ncbi:MAG: hypothetical protein KDC93_13610, partial [Cyclobacteriaceae bacterium]|nr:hypothetical protein [Cyclobacteriaceae bacterium]
NEVRLNTIKRAVARFLNKPEIWCVIVIRLGVRFYSEVHKSTLVMHYFKFNFMLEGIILNTSCYFATTLKFCLTIKQIFNDNTQFRMNLNRIFRPPHA